MKELCVASHLNRLLVASPDLERLELAAPMWDANYPDIADVIQDIPKRASFRPTVRELKLIGVTMNASSKNCLMAYLSNLRALTIGKQILDDKIWGSLHASGIKLRSITVQDVTQGLVDYLLRYRGLEAFNIVPDNTMYDEGLLSGAKYDSVKPFPALACHCDSLVALRIDYPKVTIKDYAKRWCLDEALRE